MKNKFDVRIFPLLRQIIFKYNNLYLNIIIYNLDDLFDFYEFKHICDMKYFRYLRKNSF